MLDSWVLACFLGKSAPYQLRHILHFVCLAPQVSSNVLSLNYHVFLTPSPRRPQFALFVTFKLCFLHFTWIPWLDHVEPLLLLSLRAWPLKFPHSLFNISTTDPSTCSRICFFCSVTHAAKRGWQKSQKSHLTCHAQSPSFQNTIIPEGCGRPAFVCEPQSHMLTSSWKHHLPRHSLQTIVHGPVSWHLAEKVNTLWCTCPPSSSSQHKRSCLSFVCWKLQRGLPSVFHDVGELLFLAQSIFSLEVLLLRSRLLSWHDEILPSHGFFTAAFNGDFLGGCPKSFISPKWHSFSPNSILLSEVPLSLSHSLRAGTSGSLCISPTPCLQPSWALSSGHFHIWFFLSTKTLVKPRVNRSWTLKLNCPTLSVPSSETFEKVSDLWVSVSLLI